VLTRAFRKPRISERVWARRIDFIWILATRYDNP